MANGKDVAVILGCLPFLDPPLRKVFTLRRIPAWADDRLAFPRIVAAAFVSGLVVQAIKASVPRIRPRLANLDGLTNALATFGESAAIESVSRYDRASFPSGHAAVAAGFAAALCWRYPHARPLFVGLAVSAAVQRVVASAHYPSDICIGAAIGLLVAALVLPQRDDRRDSESAGL
ncbi:MAG: phosphatase PAP2 family protein [Planctomycetia bacterium]